MLGKIFRPNQCISIFIITFPHKSVRFSLNKAHQILFFFFLLESSSFSTNYFEKFKGILMIVILCQVLFINQKQIKCFFFVRNLSRINSQLSQYYGNLLCCSVFEIQFASVLKLNYVHWFLSSSMSSILPCIQLSWIQILILSLGLCYLSSNSAAAATEPLVFNCNQCYGN